MTVFISGVSRGIGYGLAQRYVDDGHRVYGSIRRTEAAVEELASTAGDRFAALTMDVKDAASVKAAAAEVGRHTAGLDLLICNAAVNTEESGSVRPIDAIPDDELLDTFHVNVVGPLRTVRAFLPLLRRGDDPQVVVISSGAGSIERTRNGGMIPYCVSKAALNMLARRLHLLLAEDGIPVTAISPGWVRTDMGGANAELSIEESALAVSRTIAGHDRDGAPFVDHAGKPIPW